MKKKIPIAILTVITFAVFVSVAKAQIVAQIEVKDGKNGNSISDVTVPLYTVAYIYGTYQDLGGNAPASAVMIVRFDGDGSGWVYKDTLFTGTVIDGETIERTYTMTELGSYQFIWRCEQEGAGTSGISISCTNEVATDRVVTFVIPEPGTLAGLITALSALGLLAFKKLRTK